MAPYKASDSDIRSEFVLYDIVEVTHSEGEAKRF